MRIIVKGTCIHSRAKNTLFWFTLRILVDRLEDKKKWVKRNCRSRRFAFYWQNNSIFVEIVRGSPTSTVSTSTNSTFTNFSATDINFVLVEFLICKFVLVEFSLCTTQLVQISHSTIFPGPKKVLSGDPLYWGHATICTLRCRFLL